MSDEIPIGPNRCTACGGEYGEHAEDCRSLAPATGYAAAKRNAIEVIRRECNEALEHDTPWGDFVLVVQDRIWRETALLIGLKRKPHSEKGQR